jgi:hypothetical protein
VFWKRRARQDEDRGPRARCGEVVPARPLVPGAGPGTPDPPTREDLEALLLQAAAEVALGASPAEPSTPECARARGLIQAQLAGHDGPPGDEAFLARHLDACTECMGYESARAQPTASFAGKAPDRRFLRFLVPALLVLLAAAGWTFLRPDGWNAGEGALRAAAAAGAAPGLPQGWIPSARLGFSDPEKARFRIQVRHERPGDWVPAHLETLDAERRGHLRALRGRPDFLSLQGVLPGPLPDPRQDQLVLGWALLFAEDLPDGVRIRALRIICDAAGTVPRSWILDLAERIGTDEILSGLVQTLGSVRQDGLILELGLLDGLWAHAMGQGFQGAATECLAALHRAVPAPSPDLVAERLAETMALSRGRDGAWRGGEIQRLGATLEFAWKGGGAGTLRGHLLELAAPPWKPGLRAAAASLLCRLETEGAAGALARRLLHEATDAVFFGQGPVEDSDVFYAIHAFQGATADSATPGDALRVQSWLASPRLPEEGATRQMAERLQASIRSRSPPDGR